MSRRIAGVLVGVLLCAAALPLAAEPLKENFDKSYPIAADGRVSLSNVNGNVQVAVWDQNTVRVQAVKEAESSEDLANLRIEVSATASSVAIETRYPSTHGSGHHHLSVEYTVTVPKGVSLDKFELVNGSLTAAGIGGRLRARLVNGEAKLTGLTGSIEAHAVNGELDVELDALAKGQEVELETVNGGIELRLPAAVGAEVRAKTVNGHLSNDFGVPVNKHEYVGADMTGTIGSGGAEVRLETVNGKIKVTKK
jgi:DUF4097 and DUF4098 domain-containing protein YvlB